MTGSRLAFKIPGVIKFTTSREGNQKNTRLNSVLTMCTQHLITSMEPYICIQGQSLAFRYGAKDRESALYGTGIGIPHPEEKSFSSCCGFKDSIYLNLYSMQAILKQLSIKSFLTENK